MVALDSAIVRPDWLAPEARQHAAGLRGPDYQEVQRRYAEEFFLPTDDDADLKARLGMAMLLITHDLAIVRRHADRVVVMRDGEAVEQNAAAALFAAPQHPYTRMLLATQPHGRPAPIAAGAPLVAEAEAVRVHFPIRRGLLRRQVGAVLAGGGERLVEVLAALGQVGAVDREAG